MPGAPFYQPKLGEERRLRVQAGIARIADFWKAVDHRIARDVIGLQYDLEKHDITFHWFEMACHFTAMELGEIRLEIVRSYGETAAENVMQPLDRNTSQAIVAAKNLFQSAQSGQARDTCPQFEPGISFPKLRKQLQETLDSIYLKVSIYLQANSVPEKK